MAPHTLNHCGGQIHARYSTQTGTANKTQRRSKAGKKGSKSRAAKPMPPPHFRAMTLSACMGAGV